MKKIIVITGMTSGIGKALAEHFVNKGETVIGVSRNEKRLSDFKTYIKSKYQVDMETLTADFTSFDAMTKAINHLKLTYSKGIDVLINNAAIVPKKKKYTEDGFESQYQVNHLAVAYFTLELLDLIKLKKGYVITTGSDAHARAKFDPDDIESTVRFHPFRSYCRTKLYNLMFNLALRRKYQNSHLHFYTVHPGRVKTEIGTKDTSLLYKLFWKFFTRNGFKPEETIGTYDFLVYQKNHPAAYFYLRKAHNYLLIADREDYQDILYEKTLKDLKPWL